MQCAAAKERVVPIYVIVVSFKRPYASMGYHKRDEVETGAAVCRRVQLCAKLELPWEREPIGG